MYKSTTDEISGAKGGLQVHGWPWGPDVAPTVSARLSIGLVVESWPFVGACTRHNDIATLNSTICVFFLCLSF